MDGVGIQINGPGIAAFLAAAVAFYSSALSVSDGSGGPVVALLLVIAGILLGWFGLRVEALHTRANVAIKGLDSDSRGR